MEAAYEVDCAFYDANQITKLGGIAFPKISLKTEWRSDAIKFVRRGILQIFLERSIPPFGVARCTLKRMPGGAVIWSFYVDNSRKITSERRERAH